MREGIGSIQMYNIIIIFFLVVVAFLFATISYQRAFKVNTLITSHIEKYEGYNGLAMAAINRDLETIAYQFLAGRLPNCPTRSDAGRLVTPNSGTDNYRHKYCVYEGNLETLTYADGLEISFRQYTIATYVTFDLPLIADLIEIPIVSRTNRIICFGGGCN